MMFWCCLNYLEGMKWTFEYCLRGCCFGLGNITGHAQH